MQYSASQIRAPDPTLVKVIKSASPMPVRKASAGSYRPTKEQTAAPRRGSATAYRQTDILETGCKTGSPASIAVTDLADQTEDIPTSTTDRNYTVIN